MVVWFVLEVAGLRLDGMVKRTPEAEHLLAQLDSELAASAVRSGVKLSWTTAEQEHLKMIGDTIDRRAHLQGRYANCDPTDHKNLVRLSCEIRQCDNLVSRLLARINTDAPGVLTHYQSQASRRAQRAAQKRWHPGAAG